MVGQRDRRHSRHVALVVLWSARSNFSVSFVGIAGAHDQDDGRQGDGPARFFNIERSSH
jgi:hypothetical protein